MKLLELISTRLIVLTMIVILIGVPIAFVEVLKIGVIDLNSLATFTDVVFKTVAILIGAIWTLNRLYTTRQDAPQFKVESDISYIAADKFQGVVSRNSLLIYRLDIINTGQTLIKPFMHYMEVQAVLPSDSGVEYQTIYRWPQKGMHPSGEIEPRSWSAINNAISIPPHVQAVRFFIHIALEEKNIWTWHKTFNLSSLSKS